MEGVVAAMRVGSGSRLLTSRHEPPRQRDAPFEVGRVESVKMGAPWIARTVPGSHHYVLHDAAGDQPREDGQLRGIEGLHFAVSANELAYRLFRRVRRGELTNRAHRHVRSERR